MPCINCISIPQLSRNQGIYVFQKKFLSEEAWKGVF